MSQVAVLFARPDSIYKTLPDLDVFDEIRDARTFTGTSAVVAHPPCRAWGRLRSFVKPAPHEKELARFAVRCVRANGGVLEHPAFSTLWADQRLPVPGVIDCFGGFTLPISQSWFGHRARKDTYLYIVGIKPESVPEIPFSLGNGSHVIAQGRTRKDGTRIKKGAPEWRPEVSKSEREHTPIKLAIYLANLARLARVQ